MYMYVYVCICMYMYVYVCKGMYMNVCMYMYEYVYVYVYLYLYTYTNAHKCRLQHNPDSSFVAGGPTWWPKWLCLALQPVIRDAPGREEIDDNAGASGCFSPWHR